jgi:hypothetical protein
MLPRMSRRPTTTRHLRNNRRGELCETPIVLISNLGLVELAPPKKSLLSLILCAANLPYVFLKVRSLSGGS